MKIRALAPLALAAACACSDAGFRQARHLEKSGEYLRAVKAYEAFLAKNEGGPREAEAAYRAGRIYSAVLNQCPEARALFERAARLPGDSPWPARAKIAVLECPDYFPLTAGSWTYVDTLSGGANMRLEVSLKSSTAAAAGTMEGAYFAGAKRFREYRRAVSKSDWTVWEGEGSAELPILRFPYSVGRSWTAREGKRELRFTIEADDARVKTKAGEFRGCLKVKRHVADDAAWVYDYYCPGVGRAKATIGVPGKENPNTELAAYKLPPPGGSRD